MVFSRHLCCCCCLLWWDITTSKHTQPRSKISNLKRTHHTSGFPSSLFSPLPRTISRFILMSPLPSPVLFLSCSVSLFLFLSPFCDLLAMNQGWGSMPEKRWEHSGKWLFPARLHHIRMGNGRQKSVCVCVCVSVCLCVHVTLLSDQLGMMWATTA